jgi:hypothetical protein
MKVRMANASERARARRVQRHARQNIAAQCVSVGEEHAAAPTPDPSVAHALRNSQETAAALLTLDTIAEGSLLPKSFRRYEAYKQALMVSEEETESVIITLWLFVWDLFEGRSSTTLH